MPNQELNQTTRAGMAPKSFVDTAQATLAWRPLRLAYLVRAGSVEDLSDAIAYACSEVGGFSHPMLPVDRRGRVASSDLQIARLLKPEFVANFAGLGSTIVDRVAKELDALPIYSREVQLGLDPLALTSVDRLRARTLMVPREGAHIGDIEPHWVSWRLWAAPGFVES